MAVIAGLIRRQERAAHAAGKDAARQTQGVLLGTRYTPQVNAGTAPARQTIGKGKRSVWQGPRQIFSGAPVLRRW